MNMLDRVFAAVARNIYIIGFLAVVVAFIIGYLI